MVERTTCVVKPTKAMNIVVCVSSRVRSVKVQTIEGACNKACSCIRTNHTRGKYKTPHHRSLSPSDQHLLRQSRAAGWLFRWSPASDNEERLARLDDGVEDREEASPAGWRASSRAGAHDACPNRRRGVPEHSSRRQNVRFHGTCWEVTRPCARYNTSPSDQHLLRQSRAAGWLFRWSPASDNEERLARLDDGVEDREEASPAGWRASSRAGAHDACPNRRRGVPEHSSRRQNVRFHGTCWEVTRPCARYNTWESPRKHLIHQCFVMTSVVGTVDAGRDRNAGTHMIGARRDSMHLVVCIKQLPDFCANSRRFSDEHDHAPWEGAARALPSDRADNPRAS